MRILRFSIRISYIYSSTRQSRRRTHLSTEDLDSGAHVDASDHTPIHALKTESQPSDSSEKCMGLIVRVWQQMRLYDRLGAPRIRRARVRWHRADGQVPVRCAA